MYLINFYWLKKGEKKFINTARWHLRSMVQNVCIACLRFPFEKIFIGTRNRNLKKIAFAKWSKSRKRQQLQIKKVCGRSQETCPRTSVTEPRGFFLDHSKTRGSMAIHDGSTWNPGASGFQMHTWQVLHLGPCKESTRIQVDRYGFQVD